MALWGATAGVATLVGPILGGILVDAFGWEWIFFINIPVGVVGFVLAVRLVPSLPTHTHRFDWLGVALSGAAMFFLVFGIQQGHKYHWNAWVLTSIVGGLLLFGAFVLWQSRNRAEPLVPLSLFGDRNFSISSFAISTMSFTATAMGFPTMLYAQLVRGYSPLESALLFVPMAVMSIILAPIVGRFTDKVHPRLLTGVGFAITAFAIYLLSLTLTPTSQLWTILASFALLGIGMAGIWAPLAATATRNLPMQLAGAGSGVYNATRQVGAVLGSARSPYSSTPGSPHTACPAVPSPRVRSSSCRPPSATRSARRCPTRCCSRSRCSCSGWCRCCSSSSPATCAPVPTPLSTWWPRPPLPSTDVGRPRGGPGGRQPRVWPVALRLLHASTTRADMPASAALPQARGS